MCNNVSYLHVISLIPPTSIAIRFDYCYYYDDGDDDEANKRYKYGWLVLYKPVWSLRLLLIHPNIVQKLNSEF